MNILLIDNCDGLRYLCKHVLSKEGYQITEADYTNYKDRLGKETYNYDVIFLNINPIEEEFVTSLYEEVTKTAPQAQIVLLSINWCTSILMKLLNHNCIHLVIPFSTNDLLSVVENIQVQYQ